MIFANRTEAGQELALHLRKYANRDDVIVLGAPRGGVPVAFEVATQLRVPLDVFVLRKLGVPGHEEFAFGAIASGGVRVVDRDTVEGLGITGLDIERVTRAERTRTGTPRTGISRRETTIGRERTDRHSRRRRYRHGFDYAGCDSCVTANEALTNSNCGPCSPGFYLQSTPIRGRRTRLLGDARALLRSGTILR